MDEYGELPDYLVLITKQIAAQQHAINAVLFLLIGKGFLNVQEVTSYLTGAAKRVGFEEGEKLLLDLAKSVQTLEPPRGKPN